MPCGAAHPSAPQRAAALHAGTRSTPDELAPRAPPAQAPCWRSRPPLKSPSANRGPRVRSHSEKTELRLEDAPRLVRSLPPSPHPPPAPRCLPSPPPAGPAGPDPVPARREASQASPAGGQATERTAGGASPQSCEPPAAHAHLRGHGDPRSVTRPQHGLGAGGGGGRGQAAGRRRTR